MQHSVYFDTNKAIDYAGNASVTLVGGPTLDASGLTINSSTKYADLGSTLIGGSELTVAVWGYKMSGFNYNRLICFGNSGTYPQDAIAFLPAGSTTIFTPRVQISDGTTVINDVSVINELNINEWIHFAFVFNSNNNTIKIIINGVEQTNQSASTEQEVDLHTSEVAQYIQTCDNIVPQAVAVMDGLKVDFDIQYQDR